ncbi:MAG: hypothetical protein Q8N73_01245 [bacterium]|nr:hypothetical protein [bacterium]
MSWLSVAILAYLIFAVVSLIDKYLLAGPIPDPKVYTFYIGALGVLVLFLAPFVGFSVPQPSQIILSLLAGAIFIYGLFWLYKALRDFEISRVVPAIGGILPLFTLGLVYIFSAGKETLGYFEFFAFILLILGSILITHERSKKISFKSLQISAIAAFFLALSFVLTKYVYLVQPFWSGFIWIRIGGFLMAIFFFLLFKEIREEIFKKKVSFKKRTIGVFLSNQAMGAGASILQNWAIFLAPLAYVSIINALQGINYAFLLVFIIFLSLKFPQILKEEISKKILFQKIIAILLIVAGLAFLAFK